MTYIFRILCQALCAYIANSFKELIVVGTCTCQQSIAPLLSFEQVNIYSSYALFTMTQNISVLGPSQLCGPSSASQLRKIQGQKCCCKKCTATTFICSITLKFGCTCGLCRFILVMQILIQSFFISSANVHIKTGYTHIYIYQAHANFFCQLPVPIAAKEL